MRPLEVINMSEEEALELRQSEKMASRSSDLQAKLREAQETARRQSTEHEVAIGKEISARAHHQKEVKALSKQRTQDLADMVQLEQEVIALTSNFDEDGRYWEILNGEMQLIQDEKDQLQHQVDTLRAEVSQLKVGSTAVAPQEGVDITELHQLRERAAELEEQLTREKKQRLQGETESRQKIAEIKVELESASATLARVGDQEQTLASLQTEHHSLAEQNSAMSTRVSELESELTKSAARETQLQRSLEAAQSEDGARWQAASFEGNDVAYFCGLMEKMAKRQDALIARTAAMQVEQVAQQADFSFSKDRAAGLAEVGSSMQASLTTNSKTLKGMDSFVGRICKSPRTSRLKSHADGRRSQRSQAAQHATAAATSNYSARVATGEESTTTVKARNPNNPDSPRTPRSLRGVRNFSSANKIDLTSKPSLAHLV